MRIKEMCRVFSTMAAAGFIFGCALQATIAGTWEIDLRIGFVWAIAVVLIFWLIDHGRWILSQKTAIRKEEVGKIVKDIDREISDLKIKVCKLNLAGGEGHISLASVYIDRVIELEKIKDRLQTGHIYQQRVEEYTTSNKT